MKEFTKLIEIGAGCIRANIKVSASAFVNPWDRWSVSLTGFSPLAGNEFDSRLSKDEARAKVSEYQELYTKNVLNKEYFKYIKKLNGIANSFNYPYCLMAVYDDGCDCHMARESDIVSYIQLSRYKGEELIDVAHFYDCECAIKLFKGSIGR